MKIALNIRQNVNNEIVYIESGTWPLCARIKRTQLKFWLSINEYILSYPESALAKVLDIALKSNNAYLRYYKNLQKEFIDPSTCQASIEGKLMNTYKEKMTVALQKDENSKLGAYYSINPKLQKFFPNPQIIMEIERELITRF